MQSGDKDLTYWAVCRLDWFTNGVTVVRRSSITVKGRFTGMRTVDGGTTALGVSTKLIIFLKIIYQCKQSLFTVNWKLKFEQQEFYSGPQRDRLVVKQS